MASVFFITGVSSDFGTETALQALASGQRVIGTVRNRTRAASKVSTIEDKGGKILELDVTDAAACSTVFKEAESLYGQVDVLVNNAGYALLGAVEDLGDEEAATQMETNFFGPYRLIRAALPGFRTRKTGTIVNISSKAGLDGHPACGLYAASKFALEAIVQAKKPHTEEYKNVKAEPQSFAAVDGQQPGYLSKAAARIIQAVTGMAGHLKSKVLRMPLGDDCVKWYEEKVKSMEGDLGAVRVMARSTGF